MILSAYEMNQRIEQQARKAQAATPLHSAAEAAMDCDGDEDQAEEVRRRAQHEADPCPVDAPEVAHADLGKAYRDAVPGPADFLVPGRVSPEMFRQGPAVTGEAAYSPRLRPRPPGRRPSPPRR